jgi:hypothetical protein
MLSDFGSVYHCPPGQPTHTPPTSPPSSVSFSCGRTSIKVAHLPGEQAQVIEQAQDSEPASKDGADESSSSTSTTKSSSTDGKDGKQEAEEAEGGTDLSVELDSTGKAKKNKDAAKAKAKTAFTSLRQNLKQKTVEVKGVKEELKDKSKELKALEARFQKWKQRHPTKGLAKAYNNMGETIDPEKLKEILTAFAVESRDSGALEFLVAEHQEVKTHAETEGRRFVDYFRLCLHYSLDPDNIDEEGKDLTYARLLTYERMGWIVRERAPGKSKSIAKKAGMPVGCQYHWFIKEQKVENTDASSSMNKLTVSKDMAQLDKTKPELAHNGKYTGAHSHLRTLSDGRAGEAGRGIRTLRFSCGSV